MPWPSRAVLSRLRRKVQIVPQALRMLQKLPIRNASPLCVFHWPIEPETGRIFIFIKYAAFLEFSIRLIDRNFVFRILIHCQEPKATRITVVGFAGWPEASHLQPFVERVVPENLSCRFYLIRAHVNHATFVIGELRDKTMTKLGSWLAAECVNGFDTGPLRLSCV